jgi:D-alanyl-D-alanine carboxypeptidase
MTKMRELMNAIGNAWAIRIARVVEGARASEAHSPGTGRAYADGYRTGYWDGVNDTVHAAAQTEGNTLRSVVAEA